MVRMKAVGSGGGLAAFAINVNIYLIWRWPFDLVNDDVFRGSFIGMSLRSSGAKSQSDAGIPSVPIRTRSNLYFPAIQSCLPPELRRT